MQIKLLSLTTHFLWKLDAQIAFFKVFETESGFKKLNIAAFSTSFSNYLDGGPISFRQQERHLGIIKSLDAPPARKKHDVHSFVVNKDNNNTPLGPQSSNTPFKYIDIDSSMVTPVESLTTLIKHEESSKSVFNSSSDFVYPVNIEMFSIDKVTTLVNAEIKATKLNEVESWILATPTVILRKREVADREGLEDMREDLIDIPLESEGTDSNDTQLFKREILKPDQQPPVQVHIQNITEVS